MLFAGTLTNERDEELFVGENYSCTFMHSPSITTYYCSVRAAEVDGEAEKEIHQNSLDRGFNLHAIGHWQRRDTMRDRNRR